MAQPVTSDLNLWPIGNSQVSALLDDRGGYVWACQPRVDGDPLFCALLSPNLSTADSIAGEWRVTLVGQVEGSAEYLRNTPILVTRLKDDRDAEIEIIDFCPRFEKSGRNYRPVAFCRIVRPLAGSPRIRINLTPTRNWGKRRPDWTHGTNHIRFLLSPQPMRLTSDAPVEKLLDGKPFRLERSMHFFLGPDEPFVGNVEQEIARMLHQTARHWKHWVRGLAIPVEWQEIVIRSAITLKLCQHEDSGAIVAALTTSIPEYEGSGRNWDYRYCWIRDAYYTVQALNRLGALDVLEGYLYYLRNIIDSAEDGEIQPLYGVGGEANVDERIEEGLAGYRGMGPVRVGNAARSQLQHDVYGHIVLSSAHAFFDERLFRRSGAADFHMLEEIGERAFSRFDKPDASLWEFRKRKAVHTYSAAMCWAAADRLAFIALELGLSDREVFWRKRASKMRQVIEAKTETQEDGRFGAAFGQHDLDASLLQLLDIGFVDANDPRFVSTLKAVEKKLRRGDTMLRYAHEDDFGLPQTAFNFCTFWLIECLALTGRTDEARELYERMLARLTPSGLLSEDADIETGEPWGNYPQTYSLVGLINCAVLLSRPWSQVR